jgi:hypothetical protein
MARTAASYLGLNYREITQTFICANLTGNDPSLDQLLNIDKKWRRIGQEIRRNGLGSKY